MFAYCALLLMSAGDVVEADFASEVAALQASVNNTLGGDVAKTFMYFQANVTMRYLLIYCVFGMLWTMAVVDAVFAIGTSAAVSQIMWAKSRGELGGVSCCANRVAWRGVWFAFRPVMILQRTFLDWTPYFSQLRPGFSFPRIALPFHDRYHVGTAAFGGLLIAIIQLFRLAFEYFHRQFKETNQADGAANRMVQCVFRIIRCILSCLQKCVEFISHNAYALTAIQGRSFCSASKKAVSLMMRNAMRFMMVEWFSKCVVILSRVIIVFGAALACWVTVEGDERFGPGKAKGLPEIVFRNRCRCINSSQEVGLETAVKQPWRLAEPYNLSTQQWCNRGCSKVVHLNFARIRLLEAQYPVNQCGLAAAARPFDQKRFIRLNPQIELLEDTAQSPGVERHRQRLGGRAGGG